MKIKERPIEEVFLIVTLVIMVVLIFFQVIGRYVFSSAPSWTEEFTRYIHIWQVWIGASYAIRLQRHLRIDAFINKLSPFYYKIVETASNVIFFTFALYLAYLGVNLIIKSMNYGQLSPAMQWPMWTIYIAIPLGGIGMAIRLLQNIIQIWKVSQKGAEKV